MPELTYTRVGDYLLPDIVLKEPPRELTEPIGKYGRMHRAYLKEHSPILYTQLVLTERLFPLLREVDEAARSRLSAISDPDIAHEIILAELVYN